MSDDGIDVSKLVGKVLAGRYEVTGVLGAGGMGVVVEARQIAIDRKVAVKLLHPSFGTNRHAVARFVREMQVTSRLEHPSTVRVYDFGEASDADGTHLFLVMELVQGRTLGKVLAEGRLAQGRIVGIATQIARALEAAHGEGIVHRDLKPDNVMLGDRYGAADVVKVLDFGIARFIEGFDAEGANPDRIGKLTAEGAVVGTPAYMSPEQATGAPIIPASDLYSLGVMLFEMATGSVPFSAPTTVGLMVKHVQEAPPRPSDIVPVPPKLEALILRCLEKDPDKRPRSAKELAEALEALDRDGGGAVARVLRADAARFEAQKAGALAADTAKSRADDGGVPDTKDGEAIPARRWNPWWIIGAVAVAGIALTLALTLGPSSPSSADVAPSWGSTPPETTPAPAPTPTRTPTPAPTPAPTPTPAPSLDPPAPPDCVTDPIDAARAKLRDKAISEAAELARLGVRTCPRWAVAHVVLGQAAQAQQDWDTARLAFIKAIELAPGWGVPSFDLALVELSAKHPDVARDTLEGLLGWAPSWPDAHLLRAQADLALSDFDSAKADAEAATIATPDRAEAWFLLGESHRALGAAGSADIAKMAYCKAEALGMSAAAARCAAYPR